MLLPHVGGRHGQRDVHSPHFENRQLETCGHPARTIEASDDPAATPERKEQPVTIVQAVTEYLADAKARELSDATLYKLDIFFRKQFLVWCKSEATYVVFAVMLRSRLIANGHAVPSPAYAT